MCDTRRTATGSLARCSRCLALCMGVGLLPLAYSCSNSDTGACSAPGSSNADEKDHGVRDRWFQLADLVRPFMAGSERPVDSSQRPREEVVRRALVDALADRSDYIRASAATMFRMAGALRPWPPEHIAAIERCLEDSSEEVRIAAARTVFEIQGSSDRIVAVVAVELEQAPDRAGRIRCLSLLHDIGPSAVGARESVERMTECGDPKVERWARDALKRIRGE